MSDKKTGRPSKYSIELAEKICLIIATSEKGLHDICTENTEFPHVATLMRWLGDDDKKQFRELYARARETQADYMASQILRIADDSSEDALRSKGVKNADGTKMVLIEENKEFVNRSRLRVDTRKFLMAKLAPKKYGDKIEVDAKVDATVTTITGMVVK